MLAQGTAWSYAGLVPYSNQQALTTASFGSITPASVASARGSARDGARRRPRRDRAPVPRAGAAARVFARERVARFVHRHAQRGRRAGDPAQAVARVDRGRSPAGARPRVAGGEEVAGV